MKIKKKILITGSTQGIGKAMAEAFVKNDYDVIIHCSRDLQKAEKTRAELGAWLAVTADLSDLEQTKSLYEKTGPVDCLILNASVQYKNKWSAITDEEFEAQVNVNLRSTLKLMQLYYPKMQEQRFGRIITIGSVNQYRRHPELPMYAATKCAVMSLVENIAKQAAPYGVTANNIAPGAIATPRNAAVYDDIEKREKVERTIPVGRFGTPEDIVGAALYLCSDDASYMTGADLIIDGGIRL